VKIETLTGGHLLHLAVAGCLFNDILRVAAERGITVNQLKVSAYGDFGGEPASLLESAAQCGSPGTPRKMSCAA
jgi:uncharacterized OsmC-like protein